MPKELGKDWLMQLTTGGRSVKEQIDRIRREKMSQSPMQIRSKLLETFGFAKPKPKADIVFFFGCHGLLRQPTAVRNYFRLLEQLGVDITYLEEENCCGHTTFETASAEDREQAVEAAREFTEANLKRAEAKGARSVAYFCTWCAHTAKWLFPDSPIALKYYPDILVEKLATEKLRMEPAAVVGFFEGCHRRAKITPGVSFEWGKYRELLNNIEGLKVVDMPGKLCCIDVPDRIINNALDLNLDTILCSCLACATRLGMASEGRMRVQFYSDLLLEALNTGRLTAGKPSV